MVSIFSGLSQCPSNLNGNNNNPTYIIVFVYNQNFELIDTIQCNTNPSGQINCDLNNNGVYYSIVNTNCLYDSTGVHLPDVYLPIELLFFDGHNDKKGNILEWSTATEHNSSYFLIKHSTDGENYKDLVYIPSAGNSTNKIDYKTSHMDPEHGINYYQLVQFDIDGESKTYGPISIDNRPVNERIVKTIDILGREVGPDYRGLVIHILGDGSTIKEFK